MKTALKGNEVELYGEFIEKGALAPNFTFTKGDLSKYSLEDGAGKYLLLNIFPSIDTGVCSASVRKFNQMASEMENTTVLCISKDLPFAQSRYLVQVFAQLLSRFYLYFEVLFRHQRWHLPVLDFHLRQGLGFQRH